MNILTLNSDFFKYFFKLDCKWSLPQRKHLFNFVDGIINSGGKKTLSNIWRNSLNTRDRSSFNKFLLYSPWDEKNLNYARKKTALNEMSRAGSKNPFFFSIDDTLSSKKTSSKNIEGLKFNYSHVSNKNEWSHCIVSLHGHSNGLSLPLDFKTYLSEESGAEQKRSFKTKIDLALDTLEGIDIQLERKSYVLTDSWYTSAGFINKTQQLGFQVISGIKSNRIFYPDGIRAKLNEYSKTLKEEDLNVVTVKGRTHYVYRYEGAVKGIENIVVLMSWIDKFDSSKSPFYLVSTDVSLSSKKIIEYYGHRWEIEVSFRYQKERLGLDNYEMRSLKGIERFWELLYLLYNFLELKRFKNRVSENLGELIDKLKVKRKREVISYVYERALSGAKLEELYEEFRVPA